MKIACGTVFNYYKNKIIINNFLIIIQYICKNTTKLKFSQITTRMQKLDLSINMSLVYQIQYNKIIHPIHQI